MTTAVRTAGSDRWSVSSFVVSVRQEVTEIGKGDNRTDRDDEVQYRY